MKTIYFKAISYLSICLISAIAQGITTEITTLVNAQGTNYITFVGEKHLDLPGSIISKQEQDSIIKWASFLKAAVVSEDMWMPSNNHPEVCRYADMLKKNHGMPCPTFRVKLKGNSKAEIAQVVGPKDGILARCKDINLPIYNVECRHARDCSMFGFNISGQEVWSIMRKQWEDIVDFCVTDDPYAFQYPVAMVDFLEKHRANIANVERLKVAITIDAFSLPEQYRALSNGFGDQLVQALMIRAAHLFKNSTHIIYTVGYVHAGHVIDILKERGYTVIKHEKRNDKFNKELVLELDPIDIEEYFTGLIKLIASR